jgi:hypothetical protein
MFLLFIVRIYSRVGFDAQYTRDVILIWFAVHALMFDGAGSDFLAHNLSDSRKPLTQQKSVWYG